MRVPIRKGDKYLKQKPDAHITLEKKTELEKNLARLKAIHPKVSKEVKQLATDGDFSENAAYQIAKGKIRGINQAILEIEDQLNNAIIIESQKNKEKVQIGHKVTISTNGQEKTYLILGSSESNPSLGVISYTSPLGAALMGARVGSSVSISLAKKEVIYKVLKIE